MYNKYSPKARPHHQPNRRLRYKDKGGQEGDLHGRTGDGQHRVVQHGAQAEAKNNADGEEELEHGAEGAPDRGLGDLREVGRHEDAGRPDADPRDNARRVEEVDVPGQDDDGPGGQERQGQEEEGAFAAEGVGEGAGGQGAHHRADRQERADPGGLLVGYRQPGVLVRQPRQDRRGPGQRRAHAHRQEAGCDKGQLLGGAFL